MFDFVFRIDNNVTIVAKRNKKKEDQFKHVFVLNDHGNQDDYSLFDTFSILLRIVIHPEEYPRVHILYMCNLVC